MSYKSKAFIARIALAVVLGLCTYVTCLWSYNSIDKFNGERYDVPGVVIGKNIEQYAHGKHHRNMSTRYVMAVRPDNQMKFHNYSLYVDYATYCGYNVGDRIQFNDQYASKVLRGYKSKDSLEFVWEIFIPIGTCIIALTFAIWMVINAFLEYNY